MTANPTEVLIQLREIKHLLQQLTDREKKLKAQAFQMFEAGALDELADRDTPRKYNAPGVSITLVDGRKTRVLDSEFQGQIDVLKDQIKSIELQAESRRAYKVEMGSPSWRVNIEKAL